MLYKQEHREFMNSLSKFAAQEITPYVDEWEEAGIFPAKELFKKMGNQGFLGVCKPEEYGGMGLDYSFSVAMAETLGQIPCGGVPMAIGVQTDMATPALARFGSDYVKENYLRYAISGDYVACIGVSEPSAGSDVAAIKSSARKDGDDYVINGQKMWITNGTQADFMCMLVNTSDGPIHSSKSLIVVPMDTPGITVERKLDSSACAPQTRRSFILKMFAFRSATLSAKKAWASPIKCYSFRKRDYGPQATHYKAWIKR